jgi:hypothetical protein
LASRKRCRSDHGGTPPQPPQATATAADFLTGRGLVIRQGVQRLDEGVNGTRAIAGTRQTAWALTMWACASLTPGGSGGQVFFIIEP